MGIISSRHLKIEHRSHVSSSTWRRYDDFMKGGPCKEEFSLFQDCVHEAEKKRELTGPCYPILEKCMEAHSDYYQPILESDKAAEKILYEGLMKAFLPLTVPLNEMNEDANKFITFMEGGDCKESFTALRVNCDFTEEAGNNNEDLFTKCAGLFGTLLKCVADHSDYYHSIVSVTKATEEHLEKDLEALFSKAS
ncbi:hypothetical protein CARUB_v10003759mg [Capsella rubella]|uniref:GCK domain-containing protein n=1 Tax=Capsella rubella TaxID=81985 RepID=R0HDA7_9BRAS|nr:uncharacterized protein LOC17881163 [Capsella rubella]EOA23010.1 hypothetical protein CARUB_v10003759mg [Capsella rubella]